MAKIAIDAGHGRYTPGKRCLKSLDPNETREWVLNDRVADALAVYLKSAGHTTMRVDDTDGSSDISLANRVKTANNWGADAYISVHQNAGIKGGKGGGTIVFVAKKCSAKSIQLQNAVYKHAIERGNLKGNRSDGTLAENFYVIRYTNMPAILIECGFMDSETDIKYILDPAWSKQIALGIAEGVCDVYGGKVNAGATSKPASKPAAPSAKEELKVDGYWGRKSTTRFQEVWGTTVDGEVSNQWACYAEDNPGLDESSWDFDAKPNGKGSQLIRAMQKWAGMPESKRDGEAGPETFEAFQEKLKSLGYDVVVDGYVSAPSMMVKALQMYANTK